MSSAFAGFVEGRRCTNLDYYHFYLHDRFCGEYYFGSRLTSTKNTMTLVFQSWDNYNHFTGFSASYLVTGSGKYKTRFSAQLKEDCTFCSPVSVFYHS